MDGRGLGRVEPSSRSAPGRARSTPRLPPGAKRQFDIDLVSDSDSDSDDEVEVEDMVQYERRQREERARAARARLAPQAEQPKPVRQQPTSAPKRPAPAPAPSQQTRKHVKDKKKNSPNEGGSKRTRLSWDRVNFSSEASHEEFSETELEQLDDDVSSHSVDHLTCEYVPRVCPELTTAEVRLPFVAAVTPEEARAPITIRPGNIVRLSQAIDESEWETMSLTPWLGKVLQLRSFDERLLLGQSKHTTDKVEAGAAR